MMADFTRPTKLEPSRVKTGRALSFLSLSVFTCDQPVISRVTSNISRIDLEMKFAFDSQVAIPHF